MIYEAIGVYSKSPYHIPELAVSVHSFEELCHVLVEKYYDIGDYIMADELISFIGDDLALHDLADELRGARSSLTEYTKVLLSYRRYMSDEGVETVLKGISSGGEAKEYVRLISRGDYLITHRKYRPAILLYAWACCSSSSQCSTNLQYQKYAFSKSCAPRSFDKTRKTVCPVFHV